MPKSVSSSKSSGATPYAKKPKPKPEKAIRTATAFAFYVTGGQFTFIGKHRKEYLTLKHKPRERSQYLADLWRLFLRTYPEHNDPPFPEDEEMVERFHASRARALGTKLDNMLDLTGGVQHRVSKA